MSKDFNRITLSSLRRIQRLMKKGYYIDVVFYARVKGHSTNEYRVHMCCDGEIYVSRCLLETYDYDSDTYREEILDNVSLDDLTVVDDGEVIYCSDRA